MFKFVIGILSLALFIQLAPVQASSLDYPRSTLANENASAQSVNYQQRSTVATRQVKKTNLRERLAAKLKERRDARLSLERGNTDKTTITAGANSFKVTVPSDFSLIVDTLKEGTGSFVLKRTNGDMIDVMAKTDRCEGGNAAYFACFNTYWKAEQSVFMNKFTGSKVIENIDLRWKNDSVGSEQTLPDNTGRFLLLEKGEVRMAQFLFQVPESQNIWQIEFTGTKTGSLLTNSNEAKRVLLTMFTDNNSINVGKSRIAVNTALNYKKRISAASPRTNKTAYSKKDVQTIVADNEAFLVEVPNSFIKGDIDTLERTMGTLTIEDRLSAAEITIEATEHLCNSQTPNIVKNCIAKQHRVFKQELSDSLYQTSFLLEKSYDLQLLPGAESKQDYGVLTLFRSNEKAKRYGVFTWREPRDGNLWKATFTAPEDNDSILSNQQKLNAIVNSFLHSEVR